MSISGVSSSSTSYSSDSSNNEIKQLQKQRTQLEKQITQENQSKDDAKTKETKVAALQQQIRLIDARIQQKQTQKGQNSTAGEASTLLKANETTSNSSNTKTSVEDNSNGSIDLQA
ncbi:MAG TPA: FlxA-like family protein [Syntrophomonadaceae bacterium]|nr:FlxA-like family protein [Syntrophomonadaceae bacterium]